MSFETPQFIPEKAEKQLSLSRLNPEDLNQIAEYYKFEIDQGFSSVNPKTTFEKMVAFRQGQLRENKLKVIMAKDEDSRLMATSVVVLEHGTMGKEIREDEAYAAGTVVLEGARGTGIGEKMATEQEVIAREAGKKSLITVINNQNYPSMRLRMKVGYRLEGVDRREDEINYSYRKNLAEDKPVDKEKWLDKIKSGELQLVNGAVEQHSAQRILVDPEDDSTVELALQNGYHGVYLLRPEDFEEKLIDKCVVVFEK